MKTPTRHVRAVAFALAAPFWPGIAIVRAAEPTTAESASVENAGHSEQVLGPLHFTAPSGWRSAADPGKDAIAFEAPDCPPDRPVAIVILLTRSIAPAADFRARFDKAVENAAGGAAITARGEVEAGKTRQGFDMLSQGFAFQNASGDTVRSRLVATRAGDRLAAFCYLACGDDLYRKHLADMENVLGSVRFDDVKLPGPASAPADAPGTTFPAATGPASQPASGPASLPAAAPVSQPANAPATEPASKPATPPELREIEREKADLRKRLAELEAREKRLAAAFASGPDPTVTSAPRPPETAAITPPVAREERTIDLTDRSRAFLRTRYPKRTQLVLSVTPVPQAGPVPGTSPPVSPPTVLNCDIDGLPEGVHFAQLPAGIYTCSAKAVTPDAKEWPMKLTVSATPRVADWSDSVEVDLRMPRATSILVTDVPR